MNLYNLKNNLIRRGFTSEVYESPNELLNDIRVLAENKTVGYGGSATLQSLGIISAVEKNAEEVYSHLPGQYGDEERSALTADLFFTSANAITEQGEIVNIDGTGNRVAATCFGPGKVVYVIGSNKITADLPSALERAKAAAVKVAVKFNRNTPCVKTGKCEDCLSPDCVCSVTTIHRKKPYGVDVSVLLIDGEYGL